MVQSTTKITKKRHPSFTAFEGGGIHLSNKKPTRKDISGQTTIIPKPELFGHFVGDSLTKPPFGVTSVEVAIICSDLFFKAVFS